MCNGVWPDCPQCSPGTQGSRGVAWATYSVHGDPSQRRPRTYRVQRVQPCPCLQQRLHGLEMALLRRKVKGRDSVLQDGVNDGGEGGEGGEGRQVPGLGRRQAAACRTLSSASTVAPSRASAVTTRAWLLYAAKWRTVCLFCARYRTVMVTGTERTHTGVVRLLLTLSAAQHAATCRHDSGLAR